MKILITGAAGFVGSNLMNRLIADGAIVEGIDNLSFGYMKNLDPKAILWTADFNRMPEDFYNQYDVLVHMATANIIFAMQNEVKTFETNALNTINLFKRFKGRIVYTSTTSIYGNADEFPTNEYASHKCYNAYDTSKYIAELYLHQKKEFTILRLSNVYGPNQHYHHEFSGVVGKMVGCMLNGEPITIYGDGTATRDYTYVDDVVDALIKAIEQPAKNREINIASGKETSINELAAMIELQLKEQQGTYSGSSIVMAEPRKIDIIRRRCASIEAANYILGWQPKTSLKEGLKKTIEWMRHRVVSIKELGIKELPE